MRYSWTAILVALLAMHPGGELAAPLPQSPLAPRAAQQSYPKVVLFSTSWCPHCKAAKAYLTGKEIPFINRDVELDTDAMALLTGKYQSQGVPVIVIGEDEQVLRGFDEGSLAKALEKYRKK